MLIHRVALTNIKSFKQAEIEFAPGLTAIVGPNGGGKSSILEAIGFGLFGHSRHRPQSNFMRHGTSAATIQVEFTSAVDQRRYAVTRRLRRSRSRSTGALSPNATTEVSLLDVELNRPFDQPVAELELFLSRHLLPEGFAAPAEVFEHVIGVPQGRLTADFLDTAEMRKRRFDRILRTAEFRDASDELRPLTQHFAARVVTQAAAAAKLKGRLAREPEVRAQQAQAEVALATASADHVEAEQALAEAAVTLTTHEALRSAHAEAERADAAAVTGRAQAQRIEAEAVRRLEVAEAAARVVEETAEHDARYEAAQAEVNELKTVSARQAGLVAAAAERRAALARSEADLQTADELLELARDALGAEWTTDGLVPCATESQRSVEELRRSYEAAWARRDDRRERASRDVSHWSSAVSSEATKLKARRRTLRGQVANLERQLQEAEAAAAPAAERDDRVERLHSARAERTTIEALLASEEMARASLVRHGICPFFENSCRNLVDMPDIARVFDDRAAAQRQRLAALSGELEAADRAVRESDEASAYARRADGLRAQLHQASNDHETSASQRTAAGPLIAAVAAEDRIGLERALRDGAAGADGALLQAAGQVFRALGELDATRRDGEALGFAHELRAAAEAQRDRDRESRGKAETKLRSIEPEVQRLQSASEALAASRDAHESHLRNLSVAAEFAERRTDRSDARSALEAAQRNVDASTLALAAASERFDAAALAAAVGARDEALGRIQQLIERIRQAERRRAEVKAELKELENVRAELTEIERKVRHEQTLEDRTEFFREILRRAGPLVTEALLADVSEGADEIFGDILGNRSGRLRWTSDYDVVLERGGHTRQFTQLSGGEQMSAALAVRLALLRDLLQLDVAFFDEPTQHLDDVRRANLAEQLLRVRGFSQLVVITHDDTFERALDNVIRVRKTNGVSTVESA